MIKVLFLFSLCILISAPLDQDTKLVVTDSKTNKENPNYILKYEDETLELRCELKNSTEEETLVKWTLPFEEENKTIDGNGMKSSNETSLIMFQNYTVENGTVRLYISHLQVTDSGSYTCSSVNSSNIYNHTVEVIVRPIRDSCGKKFDCEDNHCIASIYKCDGFADCKNKIDESPEMCGENPCEGRIMCSNGRCIPKEWCKPCVSKMNCTNRHRPDCCPPLDPYFHFPKGVMGLSDGSYPQRYNDFPDQPNIQHRYDINFIQTTIYTVIGCALIFMIIVTILVIAICRIHMKRSSPVQLPNNRRVFSTTSYHRALTQEIGVYDLDISVNRPDGLGLLVTYNINNGVQIVGSPVDPPPYSEVASRPPREGPPPPYTISQQYDGNQEMCTLRAASQESPPKFGSRFSRSGLSTARVSSEPSLLNINNRL